MVTFRVGVITEDNDNYYKSTTTAMDTLIFNAKIKKKSEIDHMMRGRKENACNFSC